MTARDALDRAVSEADLQRQVLALAAVTGWRWYYVPDSRRSPAGWPDLTLVRDGRMLALELKSERGRVKPEQRAWLTALSAVPGVVALVVRPSDWPKVEKLLRGTDASRSPSLAGGRGSACCARPADLPDLPRGTLGDAGEGAPSWPPGGRSAVEVALSSLLSGVSPMPVTGEVEDP